MCHDHWSLSKMMFESDPCGEDQNVAIINSVETIILDLPPSCIEFSSLHTHTFIIGTYFLNQEAGEAESADSGAVQRSQVEARRSGSLILGRLYELDVEVSPVNNSLEGRVSPTGFINDIQSPSPPERPIITFIQTLPTSYAVLDLHFSPRDPNTFAVAASTGAVEFFLLDLMSGRPIISLKSIQIADPSVLVLSLAWKPSGSTPSTIAVSLSTGQIGIFDHQTPFTTLRIVQSHSLEVWTISWSAVASTDGVTNLYSGGDDSMLCRHSEDLKFENVHVEGEGPAEIEYEPLSRDTKTHGAGVTAILPISMPNSNLQEILITGSYDENIRVLEPAVANRRSKVLAEKRLGGGVWRLKVLSRAESTEGPRVSINVLASCMHAGVRILRISRLVEGTWTIRALASFERHGSMNYASEACLPMSGDVRNMTFLSTSFYDKKLCVWNFNDLD